MAYLTTMMQGASTAMNVQGALTAAQSTAYNAAVKAESDARIYDAHAQADTFNSEVARQLAESERTKSFADAADYRRTQTAKLRQREAVQAGGGLDTLEGSPLLVDSKIFEAIDFGGQRIAGAGQLAFTRYTNSAMLLEKSAKDYKDSATFAREAGAQSVRNIISAGNINAAGAGLKGATDIVSTLVGTKGSGWDTFGRTKSSPKQVVDENNLEW